MLDEELTPDLQRSITLEWVKTWPGAIALMDRYPWAELRPLAVLPDFSAEVLFEVIRRLLANPNSRTRDQMDQWLRVCSGTSLLPSTLPSTR